MVGSKNPFSPSKDVLSGQPSNRVSNTAIQILCCTIFQLCQNKQNAVFHMRNVGVKASKINPTPMD